MAFNILLFSHFFFYFFQFSLLAIENLPWISFCKLQKYLISLNILISEIYMLIRLQYHCVLLYYSPLLPNEPLLIKDTFHSPERTVRNCSLFSQKMEQENWKCGMRSTQASSILVTNCYPSPLQRAENFPVLEIPPFILLSHPSIPERVVTVQWLCLRPKQSQETDLTQSILSCDCTVMKISCRSSKDSCLSYILWINCWEGLVT